MVLAECNTWLVNFNSSEIQPLHSAVPVSSVARGGGIEEIWGQEILKHSTVFHFSLKCESVSGIFSSI